MDIKAGNKYPAGALSNFARRPFELDGIAIESMEGFLQGLKFKNPDMQAEMCKLFGMKAKKAGAKKNWQTSQTLWWRGEPIKRDSQEYQDLLDRAYNACFYNNPTAQKALLASGNATLKHSVGRTKKKETVLTIREFCSRLERIRSELQAEDSVKY